METSEINQHKHEKFSPCYINLIDVKLSVKKTSHLFFYIFEGTKNCETFLLETIFYVKNLFAIQNEMLMF